MHFYFRLGYPHLPPLLLVGWVLHLHLPEVLLASLACCLEGTPLTLSLSLSLFVKTSLSLEVTNNNNVVCLQEFLLSDVSHSHCPSPNKVHWHWWLGSQWVGSKYSQNRLTSSWSHHFDNCGNQSWHIISVKYWCESLQRCIWNKQHMYTYIQLSLRSERM